MKKVRIEFLVADDRENWIKEWAAHLDEMQVLYGKKYSPRDLLDEMEGMFKRIIAVTNPIIEVEE